MFRKLIWLFFVAMFSVPAPVLAHGTAPAEAKPASVENRLGTLEAHQAEIYHTLVEKKAAGLASQLTDRLTISGLLEIEAAAGSVKTAAGSSDAASDLTLATAQLGFGIRLSEEVRGNITLLYEEDDTPLEIDEAAVNLNLAPWFGRFGQLYLPFGFFHSHFISDPLTLELGETRETAALIGFGQRLFSVSAFLFNGAAERAGEEDRLRDWGATLVLTPLDGLELGASWLSDLADSNADILGGIDETDRVAGWSAYAIAGFGGFDLSGEILGAAQAFAAADLDANGDGRGDRPLAWNLELSYALRENAEVAVRYEGSDEFSGQPDRQYGLAASWGPLENVSFSLEYLHGEFEEGFGVDEDGNQVDSRNLLTAQLALEF